MTEGKSVRACKYSELDEAITSTEVRITSLESTLDTLEGQDAPPHERTFLSTEASFKEVYETSSSRLRRICDRIESCEERIRGLLI